MKRFGKLKLFGLVAFLTAALIFVGIDYLEGKKPPKWEWKVGIPEETLATELECNLYGNSSDLSEEEYLIYERNDFVDVEYWTSEDKELRKVYLMALAIIRLAFGIYNLLDVNLIVFLEEKALAVVGSFQITPLLLQGLTVVMLIAAVLGVVVIGS